MVNIILSNPRGFCAGVHRAINMVNTALKLIGPPIYVNHEIVHNKYVVQDFEKKGLIIAENIELIPNNSVLIFSAHGVPKQTTEIAIKKNIRLINATCPLVSKVHMEVIRYSNNNYECILIGHARHVEVIGVMGQYTNQNKGIYLIQNEKEAELIQVKNPQQLGYVTQTTLSIDDTNKIIDILKKRFPNISGPKKDDICYATQNRQIAVKNLSKLSELVIVVGSSNSSNSNRLREVSNLYCKYSILIEKIEDLDLKFISKFNKIGLTAGASTPEIIVNQIIEKIKLYCHENSLQFSLEELPGVEENIYFNSEI